LPQGKGRPIIGHRGKAHAPRKGESHERQKTAYCEYCGKEETYSCAEPEEKESVVRGVKVISLETHSFCDACRHEIFVSEIVDENIGLAFRAYKEKTGIDPSDPRKAHMRKLPRGPEADGKGGKRAKAYVLSADAYQEPYGSGIRILFVSLDRGKAEAYRDPPENEYPSAEIHEIELDEAVDEYLGGYCE
jgi:hypothetical protein